MIFLWLLTVVLIVLLVKKSVKEYQSSHSSTHEEDVVSTKKSDSDHHGHGHAKIKTPKEKRITEKATIVLETTALLVIFVVYFGGKYWRNHHKETAQPTSPAYHEKVAQEQAQFPVPVRQLVQLPDYYTPCTIPIQHIHDIYTDGEPVWILPPRWNPKKAILYSGHGHLVLEGGNIHIGEWKFWAAGDDPKKKVLARVTEIR